MRPMLTDLHHNIALGLPCFLLYVQANMKFHRVNYAMNVANALANRELQGRVAVEEQRASVLETSLAECAGTIASLNNSMIHLEDESE
jgi:hypothetical protein